jgi:hypothetical protein
MSGMPQLQRGTLSEPKCCGMPKTCDKIILIWSKTTAVYERLRVTLKTTLDWTVPEFVVKWKVVW